MRIAQNLAIVKTVVALFMVPSALATDYAWKEATSHFFHQSSSWTPAGIPGVLDRAIFDLNVSDLTQRYNVYYLSDQSIGSALVSSDAMSFVPQGHRVTLVGEGNGLEIAPDAGDSGFMSALRTTSGLVGTFRVENDVLVGGDSNSDGSFVSSVDLDVGDDVVIGDAGKGLFRTANRGTSSIAGDLLLGVDMSGDGLVLVGDDGSQLDVAGTVRTGLLGKGRIELYEQSEMSAMNIEVGISVGSEGVVVLFDSGTYLETPNLTAGISGYAQFQVLRGAHATTSNVQLGTELEGDGNLLCIGTGSQATINGLADVGVQGKGWLQASEGGAVIVDNVRVGRESTGDGHLQISEMGSLLQVAEDLVAGVNGEGTVQIQGGAECTVAGTTRLGVGLQGNSDVRLTEADSRLDITGSLTVGEEGLARIFVDSGAQLASGNATIGSTKTVGSLVQLFDPGSKWTVNGDLVIGADDEVADGTVSKLSVFDDAAVEVSGTATILPTGLMNMQAGSFAGSSLQVEGQLFVNGDLTSRVSGDGLLEVKNVSSIGDAGSVDGFEFSGEMVVGYFFYIPVGANAGTQNSIPAQLTVHDADKAVVSGGIINLVDGSILDVPNGLVIGEDAELRVQGGPHNFFLPEEADILGGGTIYGNVSNQGLIQGPKNPEHRLEFSDGVSGDGKFTGWIEMRAGINPGSDIGTLSVENLDLKSTSVVNFELAGPEAGNFDSLRATDQVTLAGNFNVVLIETDGVIFTPQLGDSFELISVGSLLGDFQIWTLPSLEPGLRWEIQRDETSLSASVGTASADFNQDGFLNGQDLLVWQRGFGIFGTAQLADGDANGDRSVTLADLAQWQSEYELQSSPAHSKAIPEPEAIALTVGVMCLFFGRRELSVMRGLAAPKREALF